MWALNMLVQRTTLGRCMRAVAEDREVAAVMGVERAAGSSRITFLLGSALGGAAGVLVGLYYTQIDFFMGYSAGPQGLHRRGARRHRQHQGRDARRPACSA